MSSIVTAKDLCLWYGTAQALNNINIEIPEDRKSTRLNSSHWS